MAVKEMCLCGCGHEAVYRCEGFDYDPKAKDRKGKAFVEYACEAATRYMRDSSADLGFPFKATRLP